MIRFLAVSSSVDREGDGLRSLGNIDSRLSLCLPFALPSALALAMSIRATAEDGKAGLDFFFSMLSRVPMLILFGFVMALSSLLRLESAESLGRRAG